MKAMGKKFKQLYSTLEEPTIDDSHFVKFSVYNKICIAILDRVERITVFTQMGISEKLRK